MNLLYAVEVTITGKVQGVCFRYETLLAAQKMGLSGHVRNMPDGSVQALFQGKQLNVQDMLDWCQKGATFSDVKDVHTQTVTVDPELTQFEIRY